MDPFLTPIPDDRLGRFSITLHGETRTYWYDLGIRTVYYYESYPCASARMLVRINQFDYDLAKLAHERLKENA